MTGAISIAVGVASVASIAGLWNFAGWAIVGWRHRGKLAHPWPFGWRVFFGPKVYVRWVIRKEFPSVRLMNPVDGWGV
jgi:hypothetical protein